ncbi:hypothetical protein A2Y83_02910 [Candidatus Falkowbacteria bacterium RBG_13_39_14]|uniref:Transcription regulator TrmB N-terminal domain-containing protein n=1 Tax=Candidatus Falkowbacteria bacterium RBG_13_39_14 TaxID=1797985 RepID=A0A1F5S6G5_9BACT|nr:MAG: hypothetical protein A2Y83_02910 [Candidatus Falkowbacteria bacterium RBG_13_39_14]
MNKSSKQILENLGMTKDEVNLYLAGLELGEDSVQNLAKKADIKRPTAYKILDDLIDKGVFYQTLKGKKRFFGAENPEKLQTALKQKEIELVKIMPELKSIYNLLEAKPKIKFYEGLNGAITVYEDTLASTRRDDVILTYTGIKKFFDFFPREYAQEYFKRRVAKNLKVKMIAIDSEVSREWERNAIRDLREIIIIEENKFNFFGDTEIYGNKVALISYKENFMAVVIESEEIANMQRFIFNLAWDKLQK